MATWTKHRRTEMDQSVDFSDVLNDGESISTIVEIVITDREGNDVSAEFGSPTGTINGEMVDFTLGSAGSASEQTKSLYRVLVEITTSDGEDKVSTDDDGNVPVLKVTDHGEPA